MRREALEILGLFPAFDSEAFGGVQASGREAWQGIAKRFGRRAGIFQYHPRTSKGRVVMDALRMRMPADTVLVWHVDLLKLIPFISAGRSRVVLFLHGIEAWREPRKIDRLLLGKTDLFLSNSEHTWQRFIGMNPGLAKAEHRTVHLGLGEHLNGNVRMPDAPPAAVMIGRLRKSEDYKGHREVIQAWPAVLKSLADATLWIVGDGDLRPELEAMARSLGIEQRVRFWGNIPDAEKEVLIERGRALLLPSTGEGFGLVYLEAMRMGRPCLVSLADAGREVINPPEGGLAVDPRDQDQLATAIVRLLSSGHGWEEMSAGARRRYDSNFTVHHFEGRFLSALMSA